MPEKTFADALDAAIRRRGVTLVRLSRELSAHGDPLSVAALSYWRGGHRQPGDGSSRDAVARLEYLLDLAPGALSDLLPAVHTPGPNRRASFDAVVEQAFIVSSADDLARALQHPVEAIALTSSHHRYQLGTDRQITSCRQEGFWRARADGARRVITTWHFSSSPRDTPEISVISGAEVGGMLWDPDTFTFVAELVLPRGLARGETVIVEHEFRNLAETEEVTHLYNVVERRVGEGSIRVAFDAAALPRDCRRHESEKGVIREEEAVLSGGGLQHIVKGFGPGFFGFSWHWDG